MKGIGAIAGALLCLRGGWWAMLVGGYVGYCLEGRLRAYLKAGHSARGAAQPPPPVMRPTDEDPYQVLGCVRSDDDATLRRAYHALAKQLHPDVLRAQGVDAKRLEAAAEAMARVNDAWRKIEQERGL